jgi:hypothetical protein
MHIQDENKSIQSEYIFRNEHRGLLRFFFIPQLTFEIPPLWFLELSVEG